ncbi:hypothetical protein Trydic_g16218 [Trypoxylus dichotomus]
MPRTDAPSSQFAIGENYWGMRMHGEQLSIIEGAMITMECQPGGHGGHLGHSMMLDPSSSVIHQQEAEHKKKRESGSHVTPSGDGKSLSLLYWLHVGANNFRRESMLCSATINE